MHVYGEYYSVILININFSVCACWKSSFDAFEGVEFSGWAELGWARLDYRSRLLKYLRNVVHENRLHRNMPGLLTVCECVSAR